MRIIISEKHLKFLINEQISSFKMMIDELSSNPVVFLNKLKTNPEFKKNFIAEYNKDTENNFKIMGDYMTMYVLKKKQLIGYVRDHQNPTKNEEYTVRNQEDYQNLINYVTNQRNNGRMVTLIMSNQIKSVDGGAEFAESANIALGQTFF